MSKSLGNYIGVAEPPNEIYGKVMSIPDSLIMDYFELVTDISDEEVEEFRQALTDDTINPMILKKRLAREIVTHLYDQKAASKAEEHFAKTVQEGEVPEEIPESRFSFWGVAKPRAQGIDEVRRTGGLIFNKFDDEVIRHRDEDVKDEWDVSRIIVHIRFAKSRGEANRLIAQEAVSIDGKKISGNIAIVKSGSIIKVGKRRFAKVIDTDILT
jgi:tyrosyl-tRNA synthetase